MRNLLGRLHAHTPESLYRMARLWHVTLTGDDPGRHVGSLYRVMTDLRAVRETWEALSDESRAIIRLFTAPEAVPLTIAELAAELELDRELVHTTARRLFRWGILARQGDLQELPVGQSPRVFVPRELVQDFRRVIDELELGDQSRSPLKTLLELRDEPEVEDVARRWGIQAIPGMRRRPELIQEILKQVAQPARVQEEIRSLPPAGGRLFAAVRDHAGPMPMPEALAAAGLSQDDSDTTLAARRELLGELEARLLVVPTSLADGARALFVPQEIMQPGAIPTMRPLPALQPLREAEVVVGPEINAIAIAWDMLTVMREIQATGAPVWVPGEAISQAWQRQLNGRLWLHGEETPPEGYLGMLLYLGLAVGVLEPGPRRPTVGAERNAIRPRVTGRVREWRSESFAGQVAALRESWLNAEPWVEAREREMIDVWGAQWSSFRRRLIEALAGLDGSHWLLVDDVASFIAEQDGGILGSTVMVASARNADVSMDARTQAIAQIIGLELETAMHWFGFVALGRVAGQGLAMRVMPAASVAAAELRALPPGNEPSEGPVLRITPGGLITLLRPTPLHVWSLLAFADAESLDPPTWQLRPGSVGRALAAGFELDHIRSYLDRLAEDGLPEPLVTSLRQWTAGYKRVRARRVVHLVADAAANREELRAALAEHGAAVIGEHEGGFLVMLPASDQPDPEEALFGALRAAGFAAQWARDAE